MSKASNQNKKRRQNQNSQSNKSQRSRRPSPSATHRERGKDRQTRSRRRRADWIKRRGNKSKSALKSIENTSAADKPLVRGSLQRVLTKSGSRSTLSEISREATAGGVIYRINRRGEMEILLVADHFDRWTIPKGHIEEGETAQETAIREVGEEAGVHHLEPVCWLGKIHFRYRRENILVLMSTQIYLFKALGDTNDIQKEDWMNGIRWFSYEDAVDIIAYRDIAKLIRLGKRRLIQRGEIDDEEE